MLRAQQPQAQAGNDGQQPELEILTAAKKMVPGPDLLGQRHSDQLDSGEQEQKAAEAGADPGHTAARFAVRPSVRHVIQNSRSPLILFPCQAIAKHRAARYRENLCSFDRAVEAGSAAYSTRNAVIGSTLAARCAGMTAAIRAARPRMTAVAIRTTGSQGCTL